MDSNAPEAGRQMILSGTVQVGSESMRSRNDASPGRVMTLKEQRMCATELAEMRNQMLR